MTARPRCLAVVTGTGTEVGKTWVAAAALGALRARGVTVTARKPAQSFEPGDGPTDAVVLGAATGEEPGAVCPRHRWYEVAMAPPMAAGALGRPAFTVGDLAGEVHWPGGVDVGVVEGAGGPRSPLAADGDTADLARLLAPDVVVLVAPAGLGSINAVRLSAAPFAGLPLVVVLNRYDDGDPVHRQSRDWLADRDGFEVVVSPEELADRLGPR